MGNQPANAQISGRPLIMGDAFENGCVLVTGASQGIGRHIAIELAKHTKLGLLLSARNHKGLDETAGLCKKAGCTSVRIQPADITKEADIGKLVESAISHNCSVLVNNAGYFLSKPVLESDREEYLSQFKINALAAIDVTNRLVPHLKQQSWALVVFTCSVTAQKGQARCGAYSVSKHALNGYIQSLREALLDTNVAVSSLVLGQTHSPSWDGLDVDPERLINPEDVGKAVAMLTTLSPRTCIEELVIRPQKGDL